VSVWFGGGRGVGRHTFGACTGCLNDKVVNARGVENGLDAGASSWVTIKVEAHSAAGKQRVIKVSNFHEAAELEVLQAHYYPLV
jgi:hypothetical protein